MGVFVDMYGRDASTWQLWTDAALAFLIDRARLAKVTTYTELNTVLQQRTGLPGFNFDLAEDRAAMGHLLGLVVERNRPASGLMISALVHYLNANDAGPGFYTLAKQLQLLPSNASSQAKWEFWLQQVKAVHDYYAPRIGTVPTSG